MKQQMSFAQSEYAGKKKVTRREKFLGEMERAVPWARLCGVIEPHYPQGKRGRPPIGIERMLRIYFLQQWYALADEALDTLQAPLDGDVVAAWIAGFLAQASRSRAG